MLGGKWGKLVYCLCRLKQFCHCIIILPALAEIIGKTGHTYTLKWRHNIIHPREILADFVYTNF
ncbi:MAG: hypothetical protein C4523_00540 [Myxococcales bacterium]|nr:MAG: hypothetical protein C4523_00540 [Myxococcales bacterium]